jgi:hypothetical protein
MTKAGYFLRASFLILIGGFGISIYAHSFVLGMGIVAIAIGFIVAIFNIDQ